MVKYDFQDDDLAAWIDRFTAERNPRIVDLCALAKEHYFHPAMKGSVSIKYVLPAVWESNEGLRGTSDFRKYVGHDANGRLLNPYATLPTLPIGAEEEAVREGTGAMRVYQEMMFGKTGLDAVAKENCRRLLLQYCELDTAAMVIIWQHWAGSAVIN